MPHIARHILVPADTSIAADSQNHDYSLSYDEGVPVGSALLVKLASTGSISVAVSVLISHDGTNWYACSVETLVAAGTRSTNAASITLTANTQAAILRTLAPAPYLRVRLNNSGDAAAVMTVTLLAPQ